MWLTQPIRDLASHELVEGERIVGDGLTDDGADALGNLVIAEQLRPGQHVVCVRRNGCGQRGCCSSSDVVGTDEGDSSVCGCGVDGALVANGGTVRPFGKVLHEP